MHPLALSVATEFAALAFVSAIAPAGTGAGAGAAVESTARSEKMVREEKCMVFGFKGLFGIFLGKDEGLLGLNDG